MKPDNSASERRALTEKLVERLFLGTSDEIHELFVRLGVEPVYLSRFAPTPNGSDESSQNS